MTEFLKKLIHSKPAVEKGYQLEGKRGVTSVIEVARGKNIKVVREDILQSGLRKSGKQVA